MASFGTSVPLFYEFRKMNLALCLVSETSAVEASVSSLLYEDTREGCALERRDDPCGLTGLKGRSIRTRKRNPKSLTRKGGWFTQGILYFDGTHSLHQLLQHVSFSSVPLRRIGGFPTRSSANVRHDMLCNIK
jgi:hypothetical protein